MSLKLSTAQAPPEFLTFLDQKLRHPVRPYKTELGLDTYRVDLSAWKLRLGSRTPVIVIGEADAADKSAQLLAQTIMDVWRIQGNIGNTPLVLMAGDGAGVRDYFKSSFHQVVVLDAEAQQAVMNSHRPSADLLERISAQISLLSLSPYETSKPVVGSRFFGRESIVRRILTDAEANYAVMGIRRIGKTSLLKEIEERWRENARSVGDEDALNRILYMDVSPLRSPELFMREVVRKLQIREISRIEHRHFPLYFPDFLERMARKYRGPVFFLLDEFDAMLSGRPEDRQMLKMLRTASMSGHARFVVAGFRDLAIQSRNQDSPVYNFARDLRLKEFTRNDTAAMIVDPMRNLGVQVTQRNEIVDRIYTETAGQPNLIQYYCQTLIQRLEDTGTRTIGPESLFAVHENESLRSFVLDTFWDNTNHLEKAIVFVVMLQHYPAPGEFTLEDIDLALKKQGIAGMVSDLEQACRNLVLAGTFAHVGLYYRFATPIFPRILGESHNVEYLLRKVLEESVF